MRKGSVGSVRGLLLLAGVCGMAAADGTVPSCLIAPSEPDTAALRILYQQPARCWPAPNVNPDIDWRELGPLPPPPYPADNPYTAAKFELGRRLFFDPRLSASNQIACASCHDPDLGWADGRRVSFGHDRRRGMRNTPSLLNNAYQPQLFWDGRARRLEHQVLMAISSEREMNADPQAIAARLQTISGYRAAFRAMYGESTISQQQIAAAVATFVRTLTSRKSRFDRFVEGGHTALSDSQLRGLHLFRTRARCLNCHHGPTFSDGRFHNLGLHQYGRQNEDRGRWLISGEAQDMGAFRTPGLRDVMHSKPWMHTGRFADMAEIIQLYSLGGLRPKPKTDGERRDPLFPRTSPLLQQLELDRQDRRDLMAFLEAISTRPLHVDPPEPY